MGRRKGGREGGQTAGGWKKEKTEPSWPTALGGGEKSRGRLEGGREGGRTGEWEGGKEGGQVGGQVGGREGADGREGGKGIQFTSLPYLGH